MRFGFRQYVIACVVFIVSTIQGIASAEAQATVSGPVTVNFGFHSNGGDDGYWAVDSITNGMVLTIPPVWNLTVAPAAIGPGTVNWADKSTWSLPTLDSSSLAIGHTGSGSFTSQINHGNTTTLDVLMNAQGTGPTEGAITYVAVDLLNITPSGQPPANGDTEEDSNQVSSKFNVTIPTGAHVIQPDGANAPTSENLTVQSGASLVSGYVSRVRHNLTNHGSGSFSGTVGGDFINDALSASGNVATIGALTVQGQLQNTGELQIPSAGGLTLQAATTNAGTITNSGSIEVDTLLTNNGSISFLGGQIVGAGTLTNNGSLQWSGGYMANPSLVNNSVFTITGSTSHTLIGSVTNHGTITQSSSTNTNIDVDTHINGGLTNASDGLYDITSDSGLAGGAAANAGIFRKSGGTGISYISDPFTNSGTIAVNTGTLWFTNDLTLNPSSTLRFQLSGTTPNSDFGKLNESALALTGGLQVTLGPGFAPALGNSFDLLDWSQLSGTFSSLQLPSLATGLRWNTSQLYATGVLSVAAIMPGDFNQDGSVDAADIAVAMKALADLSGYKSQYGITAANLSLICDVNGDGNFTSADLQKLLINLKNGGGSAEPVPEPSSMVLAIWIAGVLFARLGRQGLRTAEKTQNA